MNKGFEHLWPKLPKGSSGVLRPCLDEYPGKILLVKPRKTKLGDYRIKQLKKEPVITINNNLGPISMLITLTHELAHHIAFTHHGLSIRPHGKEWKHHYGRLLSALVSEDIFPDSLNPYIKNHLSSPSYTSTVDDALFLTVQREENSTSNKTRVAELKPGQVFSFRDKGEFKLLKKRRRLFLCKSLGNQKEYLFQPISEVKLIK